MNTSVSTQGELYTFAQDCRKLFLAVLAESIGHGAVAGSCLYAAVLVAFTAHRFLPLRTVVRGGDGEGDGGYKAPGGALKGHYWVEAWTPHGAERWVVDITADQFGGEACVVIPLEQSREQYIPGDQATVNQHLVSEGYPQLVPASQPGPELR